MQTSSKIKILGIAFAFLLANTLAFTITPAMAAIAPNSAAGGSSSYNWSGYVATGNAFTSITGTWTVPKIADAASLTGDAAWVGIGGVTGSDLIQAGTMAITGNGGAVQYQAWVEILPQTTQQVPLAVSAGDSITSTVNQVSPGQWAIDLKNNTTGQSYSTNVAYDSSNSSAEWIEEMPLANNGFLPLDDFGQIGFSGGSAVENGQAVNIAQAHAQALSMISSGGAVLASPSALGSDGSSFTVTRSSVAAGNSAQNPTRGGTFTIIPVSRRFVNPDSQSYQRWQQQQQAIQQQLQQQMQAQWQQFIKQWQQQQTTQPTQPQPTQPGTVVRQVTPNGWSITWSF